MIMADSKKIQKEEVNEDLKAEEELGEIKSDIKEMKAEENNVIRRIEILEEGKRWSSRMITGALFSGILSLVISILAHFLGV